MEGGGVGMRRFGEGVERIGDGYLRGK